METQTPPVERLIGTLKWYWEYEDTIDRQSKSIMSTIGAYLDDAKKRGLSDKDIVAGLARATGLAPPHWEKYTRWEPGDDDEDW